MMKKEIRKCAVCGKKFVAKALNQKYCSIKCKNVEKSKAAKKRMSVRKAMVKKYDAKNAVAKKDVRKPVKKVAKATAAVKVSDKAITTRFGFIVKVDVIPCVVKSETAK